MKAKFFKANLILVVPHKLNEITKGVALSERMENPDGTCPKCGHLKWWLYPKECVAVREGGKQYIECLNCGYTSHL